MNRSRSLEIAALIFHPPRLRVPRCVAGGCHGGLFWGLSFAFVSWVGSPVTASAWGAWRLGEGLAGLAFGVVLCNGTSGSFSLR